MKKITFLFLVLSCHCFAQNKEANNWYFGAQAGINFSGGSPVSVTNCSFSFNAFEGVGAMSDTSGNLLFYTDGNHVINANHVVMPNGNGLLSNTSSTQTGFPVKQPGNNSIYYLFHINFSYLYDTIYYSTIDMSLNSGLGDVVLKNQPLRGNTTEKVTGVYQSNGTDIWIVTHDMASNTFAVFSLTSSGLSLTPVLSSTGSIYTDDIGYLKTSPQGNKIASADFAMSTYSIFDFDNATGIISNANVSPSNYLYAYGCEWSADGTKLYGGQENSNDLWQFDVSATNVWSTATLIYETQSQEYEGMQRGPDGKIYTSRYQTAWLGVINDPDSLGAACNYVDNGVSLQGRVCYLGLPNYIPKLYNPQQQPSFFSSDTNVCQKFCINFYDSSPNNPTAWQWSFPGGVPSSSTTQNPVNICYQVPGVYDVTLITTNAGGNDTMTLSNFVTVYPTPPIPVIMQSGYTLTSSVSASYQWQFNTADIPGATNQSYTITQSGFYTVVTGDSNGCDNSANLSVVISGVDELDNDGSFFISPNPSSGNFTVELLNKIPGDEILLEVVNSIGQVIYSSHEKFSGTGWKKDIDLSFAARGVYFLEIKTANEFMAKKILIGE